MFWSDADAVVTDFSRSLDEILGRAGARGGGADLCVSADPRGLNSGHFFLRNSPAAIALIDAALARTDARDHPCHEQEALVRVLRDDPGICRVAYVPQRLFNSYPDEMGDGASRSPGRRSRRRAVADRRPPEQPGRQHRGSPGHDPVHFRDRHGAAGGIGAFDAAPADGTPPLRVN